jgi:hypothetical protein
MSDGSYGSDGSDLPDLSDLDDLDDLDDLLSYYLLTCFVFCFLKDLLFLHQCKFNIITERTLKIK